MKITSLVKLFAAAATLGSVSLNAQVIDFEDLTAAGGLHVPTLYHGFTFSGGQDTQNGNESWESSLPVNYFGSRGASSGTAFAWSNGGTSIDFARANPFNVSSMSMVAAYGQCGALSSNSSVQQTVNAFLNNVMVSSQVLSLSCSAVSDVKTLNLMNVDRVSILQETPTFNVLVDDITYSDVTGGPVVAPEPSTVALMTAGLLVVGFVTRRRRA